MPRSQKSQKSQSFEIGYGYACYRNIFFRSPKLTSDVQFLFWLRWASICVAADNLWRLGQKSKLHIPSYLCMYRSPEKITWGHFTNFYGHIHLLASGSIFFRELWWCIVSFLPKNHHLKSGLSINQLSFIHTVIPWDRQSSVPRKCCLAQNYTP